MQLFERLNEFFDDRSRDLYSTDTLEETAYLLGLIAGTLGALSLRVR